jgi:hypothetical protein
MDTLMQVMVNALFVGIIFVGIAISVLVMALIFDKE